MNFEKLENKMVFRRDNDYGTFYTIGMSKKLQDGSYENGYIDVRFKKDIELQNQTRININESWLTFYTKENGEYKETHPYIFINDFEIVEETIHQSEEVTDYNMEQIEIDVDDLPF